MPEQSKVEARVQRSFKASPEHVFDAWLTTKSLGQWMFGRSVRDEEIVSLTLDPKVGGSYSFVVRRKGKGVHHIGKYIEIDRPRRLMLTWGTMEDGGDTSRVILDIAPRNGGSDVTLTHEMSAEWADFVKQSEAAWSKMLDALARSLS